MEFFLKINNRACTFIRYRRVGDLTKFFSVRENVSFFHTVLHAHSLEIQKSNFILELFREINLRTAWLMQYLISRNFWLKIQFGNYGNLLSHFFGETFVKTIFSVLNSWFDDFFPCEQQCRKVVRSTTIIVRTEKSTFYQYFFRQINISTKEVDFTGFTKFLQLD